MINYQISHTVGRTFLDFIIFRKKYFDHKTRLFFEIMNILDLNLVFLRLFHESFQGRAVFTKYSESLYILTYFILELESFAYAVAFLTLTLNSRPFINRLVFVVINRD